MRHKFVFWRTKTAVSQSRLLLEVTRTIIAIIVIV